MSDELLEYISVWTEVHMICIWFSWCTAIPSSLASYRFTISGAGLPRLS